MFTVKNNINLNPLENFFYYLDSQLFFKVLDGCIELIGMGYGGCYSFAFSNEYEDYEEGYFGDKGVKFVVLYPTEKEEVFSLSELYKQLNAYAKIYINQNPNEKIIVKNKLTTIKKIFENSDM